MIVEGMENNEAASIQDGRWSEHKDRMRSAGVPAIYIIEGNFKDARFSYESLTGAVMDASLREGIYVFRTWYLEETKHLLQQLVKKMPAVLDGEPRREATLVSKRKKDSLVENIWIKMPACIPTFSEKMCRAIMKHFGTLADLQERLRDVGELPQGWWSGHLLEFGSSRLFDILDGNGATNGGTCAHRRGHVVDDMRDCVVLLQVAVH